MGNFKVIEKGRLCGSSMSKIVGGKPCTNNNCGVGGFSCNTTYGKPSPCPGYSVNCPCRLCNDLLCPIYKSGGGGKPDDLELM